LNEHLAEQQEEWTDWELHLQEQASKQQHQQ
jgi:hypothetical protein